MTRPRRFHTVAETAEMFGLGVMTVYRAIWEGQFPAVKVRNTLRIPAQAIDRMEADAIAKNSLVDAADYAGEVA